MTMGPDKVASVVDMFRTRGTAGLGTTTGTSAYDAIVFPPGKKSVQVSFVTSATATVNVQNSHNRVAWFNVLIATNTSVLAEVDSVVPYWRINVTAHATSGTGADALIHASIAQLL